MALPLILIGLILMVATIYNGLGLILLIIGLVMLFVYPVGPGPYFGRRW